MKIGLLGGTFDPIHNGHLHLAREARKKLALDKVLFIPAYQPPHKKEPPHASPDIRREMLVEALQGEASFEISDLELQRKGVSYSIDTLKELGDLYPPGTEFFFVTGADALKMLHHWKDLSEIFKRCHFVVARRPGFDVTGFPQEILWLEIDPLEISSTQVRSSVRKNKNIRDWVPSGVARIIQRKNLYKEA